MHIFSNFNIRLNFYYHCNVSALLCPFTGFS
jgi:hypothetical protein